MNLRGLLVIPSCSCFTLRTMFISSLGGGGGGGGGWGELKTFLAKSNFCTSLPILVVRLFTYFILFVLCLI